MYQLKRYDVVIRGNVQDMAYRKRIESTADMMGIKGYDFNDVDGSVKIVCEGAVDSLDRFFEDIEIKETPTGISVESVDKKEIPSNFSLPPQFARLEIEELAGMGRKLDIGNESLKNIEGSLVDVKGSMKGVEGSMKNVEGSMEGVEGSMKNVEGSMKGVEGTLKGIESTQNTHTTLLEGIGKSLESLPERIAKALKSA